MKRKVILEIRLFSFSFLNVGLAQGIQSIITFTPHHYRLIQSPRLTNSCTIADVRTLQMVQTLFSSIFNYKSRIKFLQFRFDSFYNIVAAVCSITEDEGKKILGLFRTTLHVLVHIQGASG